MEPLVVLLGVVLIFAAVWWGAHRIAAAFKLPDQIMVVVDVGLVLLAVFYLARRLGLG